MAMFVMERTFDDDVFACLIEITAGTEGDFGWDVIVVIFSNECVACTTLGETTVGFAIECFEVGCDFG